MRKVQIKQELQKRLIKLSKKDNSTYNSIMKKIDEVADSSEIEHYKNLRYEMKEYKRVHIGHFVLIFKYDKLNNILLFEDYQHHDKIYSKYFVILF